MRTYLYPSPGVEVVGDERGEEGRENLSSLLGCATAWSRAELPLRAKNTSGERGRGRRKDGDMRKGTGEQMREGNVEGCRDGVESIAYCTVLCSSQHHPEHEHFFNHSTESRAEDACHTTPSARITAATLRTAPPLPFPSPSAPTRLTVPLSCSFFLPHLCSRSLALHLALSPSSALLVCVTVSFARSSSLLLPPPPFPSSCSGWIETFCLLQGMLFLPY